MNILACFSVLTAIDKKVIYEKATIEPVCFGSKGDRPATFKIPRNGFVHSFRLTHISGYVSCAQSSERRSNWGCLPYEDIFTLIAYPNKTIIFPDEVIPGYDPMSLILERKFDSPRCFSANEELKIWFIEDFYNDSEDKDKHVKKARFEKQEEQQKLKFIGT